MDAQPAGAQAIGKICPHCQGVISVSVPVTFCTACGAPQHWDCWTRAGGCGVVGCSQSRAAAPGPRAGERACPTCGYVLEPLDRDCPRCELQRQQAASSPPPSASTAPGVGGYPPPGGPPPPSAGTYPPGAYAPPGAGTYPPGGYAQPAFPPEIGRWNWGAFALSVFWAGMMRQWGWFIAILVGGPLTCGLLALVAQIYLGIKGNELAWTSRPWRNAQHFSDIQQEWNTVGLVVFIINAAVLVIYLFLIFALGLGGLWAPNRHFSNF